MLGRGTVNFIAPSISTILCTTAAYERPAGTPSDAQLRTAAETAFSKRGNQPNLPGYSDCKPFLGVTVPTDSDFGPFDNAFFMPAVNNLLLGASRTKAKTGQR